jgi:hypothetical protein
MSGSIRLTGPTGAMGIGLTNVRRTTGAYADLDFANSYYELGGRVRKNLSDLSGFTFTGASLRGMFDAMGKWTFSPNNLIQQSQTLGTTWSVVAGMSVTADATTAPDGTATADKLVTKVASSSQALYQSVVTGAIIAVVSIYAKPAGYNWIGLGFGNGANTDGAFFNVSTGAIGTTVAGSTATITSVGNGWYRCSVARLLAAGTNYHQVEVHNADNQGNWSADGSGGTYLWGAQLEAVTYQTTPSAYNATTAAAYYGPRLVYDPTSLVRLGFLHEPARTNACLYCRDLTNAAYVKTTATAAKDQTGIDGVANSASSLTATAPAATVLQTIVLASSTRQQSAWVKRITGSGVVNMTTDGTTWTAIAVTAGWTRVTIPAQVAVVNPVLGFQIMTSGDAIAVDFVQNEGGTGAFSEIFTTSAAATRAADFASLPIAQSYPIGLTVWWRRTADTGAAQIIAQLDAGDDTQRAYASVDSSDLFAATTSGSGLATVAGATAVGTDYKGSIRIATNDVQAARSGVLGTADVAATNPTSPTRLVIASASSSGNSLGGIIERIIINPGPPSDAQLQARAA